MNAGIIKEQLRIVCLEQLTMPQESLDCRSSERSLMPQFWVLFYFFFVNVNFEADNLNWSEMLHWKFLGRGSLYYVGKISTTTEV